MLRLVVGVFALMLSGVLQTVYAESARGIVFFSGGQTTAEQDEFNGTATSFKLGSGFQATQNSSVEIYWTSYGEAVEKIAGVDFKAEAFSMALQYAYHYPLAGNISLLAKGGFALWKTHYGFVGYQKESDDGIDPIITVGSQFNLGSDWAIRVEWEYAEFDDTDVSLISAGFLSYFD